LRRPARTNVSGGMPPRTLDHSLVLGRVEFQRYSECTPPLFHGGRYEKLGQGP
jgi:hypothetical protein